MKPIVDTLIKRFSTDTRKILRDNLVAEYLFGSIARDETDEFSDIDVLIVVKRLDYQIRNELSRLASEYSLNHGVCFSPVIKDEKVWELNKSHETLFYREIQREGVRLC